MTKFKVGDMVMISGVITEEHYARDVPYLVKLNSGFSVCANSGDITDDNLDTTFRDQAAIAALQAVLAEPCSNEHSLQGIAEYAFDLADALDAERKKRDGGE